MIGDAMPLDDGASSSRSKLCRLYGLRTCDWRRTTYSGGTAIFQETHEHIAKDNDGVGSSHDEFKVVHHLRQYSVSCRLRHGHILGD